MNINESIESLYEGNFADESITKAKLSSDIFSSVQIQKDDGTYVTAKIITGSYQNGLLVGDITLEAEDGTVLQGMVKGLITANEIEDGAITKEKLSEVFVEEIDYITTQQSLLDDRMEEIESLLNEDNTIIVSSGVAEIEDGSITTSKLADGAITTVKILDGTITSGKLQEGIIQTTHLAENSISTAKLVDGSITTNKLLDSIITTSKLSDGSITSSKLASLAVTAEKISTGAVTTVKLADGSVTTAKITNGSITNGKLAEGSVLEINIADEAIATAKVEDGAITNVKIEDGTIHYSKLSNAMCSAGQILKKNGSNEWFCGTDIGGTGYISSVTDGSGLTNSGTASDPILDVNVDNTTIEIATDALQVKDDSITGLKLANDAVTTVKILDANVTNGKLANGAVTEVKLSDGSVTSAKISNSTIVDADISASASIAYSKLNLSSSIVNADIANLAGINYSKLDLTSSVTNSDISATAAIAYSKLNLTGSLQLSDLAQNGCSSGQLMKWNGSNWACSEDTDTDTNTQLSESEVQAFVFDGDNTGETLASGTLALGSLSFTGELTDAYVSNTITVGSSGSVDWAALNNYPSACASGSAITGVGDTLTCSVFFNEVGDIPTATPTNGDITHLSTADQIYDWVNSIGFLTSYSETDPIYSAWNKSTGISITESQISDLGAYITDDTSVAKNHLVNSGTLAFTWGDSEIADTITVGSSGSVDWAALNNYPSACASGSAITGVGDTLTCSVFFNEVGDIPTATPTNGDTTHLSTADQIYDWVNSIGFLTSYSETDPIYSAWNKSTGISITESQISDFGAYITDDTSVAKNHLVNSGTLAFVWGDSEIADAITISSSGSVDWAALNNYPSACSSGQAIQAVGDTLTCVDISSSSGITGSGTDGTLSRFSGTNTIEDSGIIDGSNSQAIGIDSDENTLFYGDILPNSSCTDADADGYCDNLDLGADPTTGKAFHALYVEELYTSGNSIYMNGVKVLESASANLNFTADTDQSMQLQTSGSGNLQFTASGTGSVQFTTTSNGDITLGSADTIQLSSSGNTTLQTSALNSNIILNAAGSNSQVQLTATDEVDITVTTVDLNGNLDISGTLTSAAWNGDVIQDAYIANSITISSLGSVDWISLDNYPSACSSGYAVTGISDTISCALFFDNISDIPTATPSDGDTTHLSTADQIYDWIDSLGFSSGGTETDPQVGSNTLNYLSKWNDSALVTSSIYDNGGIGIGTTNVSEVLYLYKDSPGSDEIIFKIGTSTDEDRFHVDEDGDVFFDGKLYFDGGMGEYIYMASGDFYVTDSWNPTGSSNNLGTLSSTYRWGTAYLRNAVNIGDNLDYGGIWYDDSTNYMFIGTDGITSSDLSIDESGELGIGNTNPLSLLHVGSAGTPGTIDGTDDVYVYDDLEVGGTIYGDGSNLTGITVSASGSDGMFQYNNGGSTFAGTSTFYWDDVNGRVGLGLSDPDALFEISNNTDGQNMLHITNTYTGVNTYSSILIDNDNVDDLVFATRLNADTSYNRFDITADGKIQWKTGSEVSDVVNLYSVDTDLLGTDDGFYIAGNLGIGITSPDEILHIYGGTDEQTSKLGNNYGIIQTLSLSTNLNALEGRTYDDTGYQSIGLKASANIGLLLNTTGEVGIGNIDPMSLLHVGSGGMPGSIDGTDDLYVYDDLEVGGTIYGDGSNLTGITASATPGGTNSQLQYNDGGSMGGAGGLYWDDVNSRLGIGLSDPDAILEISDTLDGQNMLHITNYYTGVNGYALMFLEGDNVDDPAFATRLTSDTSYSRFSFRMNGKLEWGAGNTTRDVNLYRVGTDLLGTDDGFYSGGNLGIGTTSPAFKLQVTGTGSSGSVGFPTTYGETVGGTNRDLYIDNTGKLGYVSSSIRYKENVTDISSIDWLYDLRPVEFDYKSDSTHAWGLIAEEVESIQPMLVSYNDEGLPETVQYSSLVIPLLKSIQEQQLQIDELGTVLENNEEFMTRLEALEGQVAGIDDRLTTIEEESDLVDPLFVNTCDETSLGSVEYDEQSGHFYGCRSDDGLYEWVQLD